MAAMEGPGGTVVGGRGLGESSEQAVRVSEMRYRRLFETARDGILILDGEDGRVIDANPYLVELLGYPRADIMGKPVWDVQPYRPILPSRQAFEALRAAKYLEQECLPLKTSDGRTVQVGVVSNLYLVGSARTIQCNIRDISERVRAEAKRLEMEEQLREAQKMEALGGFASGIAHDFNNLLSVILCYTEFVLGDLPAESPSRADILEVEGAARRAALLSKQLLTFSRKQVVNPVPLNLNQVFAGVEKMLSRIMGEDIELIQKLAPDLGLTMADPGHLEQVVMNLAINARDAMPRGGQLTIETSNVELDALYAAAYPEARPGPHVMMAISDTGVGMDEATLRRVFEPLFTTKAAGKGTGLGLSTVHGIVRRAGGTIRVSSKAGHGTSFVIYLPRALAARASVAVRPPAVAESGLRGAETILVIEDEQAVRQLAERILAAAGYTVLNALNGRDAIHLCESYEGQIALVLTDVVMPKMSGRMFAEQLIKIRPTTKVLFMSGHSAEGTFDYGAIEAGTRFVEKPFSASELNAKVREILDDHPVALDSKWAH